MDNSTLIFVQTIFRHGIRAPNDHGSSYCDPEDSQTNELFKPFGKGELTLEGRKQCYEFGKELRVKYNDFLGSEYLENIVEAHSSEIGRARITLQLVLAGLFPPTEATKIDDNLNWQPMKFNYKQIHEDPLFGRILIKITESGNHPQFQNTDNSIEVINCIENALGWKVFDNKQIMMVYDIIKSKEIIGFPVPTWAQDIYPHKMNQEIREYFEYHFSQLEYKKEGVGEFAKKIVFDMWKRTKDLENKLPKISLFSGHDINIIALMEILDFPYKSWPKYMGSLTFELHKISDEYYVKIIFIDGYNYTSEKAERIKLQQTLRTTNGDSDLWKLSDLTKKIEIYFP